MQHTRREEPLQGDEEGRQADIGQHMPQGSAGQIGRCSLPHSGSVPIACRRRATRCAAAPHRSATSRWPNAGCLGLLQHIPASPARAWLWVISLLGLHL